MKNSHINYLNEKGHNNGFSHVTDFFSQKVLENLNLLRQGTIDNLLIRGLEISENLPETPKKIRDIKKGIDEYKVIKSVGEYFGNMSYKGIENSIRFTDETENNTETWHNHQQYKFSVFLCLRDDPNPKTFLISANKIIQEISENEEELLLKKYTYLEGVEPFSLIEKTDEGKYFFARKIFSKSDLENEGKIPDLDLPDAIKGLEKIKELTTDSNMKDAILFLLNYINSVENSEDYFTFTKGDLMIVNERSTIRFSPSYTPSTERGKERWILALSIV